ncbi:hypothetical protein B0J13DRAFT_220981 [Dactylonectria estremocensis]|uniref:Uncharacterized protein n=1 Tax=Dactylonectria estremocensis TaxID=1079267 RepID=A0A9P9F760_9HYPO|nr:hypothetical protein B0J13DRAFT_220981 [Dactylonectria estremocensis]
MSTTPEPQEPAPISKEKCENGKKRKHETGKYARITLLNPSATKHQPQRTSEKGRGGTPLCHSETWLKMGLFACFSSTASTDMAPKLGVRHPLSPPLYHFVRTVVPKTKQKRRRTPELFQIKARAAKAVSAHNQNLGHETVLMSIRETVTHTYQYATQHPISAQRAWIEHHARHHVVTTHVDPALLLVIGFLSSLFIDEGIIAHTDGQVRLYFSN